MARPQRNNVDYFPFYCDDGKKMFYIEETYGNDGFAVFVKILRELARTDYHYLDLSKSTTKMFLSAKCKVSKEILLSIITDLVDLEKFDRVLWEENQIIWCQDFIDSIEDAYSKRTNGCITYKGLLQLLVSLGVRKPSKKNRKPQKSNSKGDVNPQSIVDNTILDNSIEDNGTVTPFNFKKSFLELGVDKQILNDWLKVRKAKKSQNTETAFNAIINQIEKSDKSANECITICAENSWSGFKLEWLKNLENGKNQQGNGKGSALGTHRVGEDFSEGL